LFLRHALRTPGVASPLEIPSVPRKDRAAIEETMPADGNCLLIAFGGESGAPARQLAARLHPLQMLAEGRAVPCCALYLRFVKTRGLFKQLYSAARRLDLTQRRIKPPLGPLDRKSTYVELWDMPRRPNNSRQTRALLSAFLERSRAWRHGYDLSKETGLRSGTLYPLLMRLSEQGLLESRWQEPERPGLPPRHVYRLTASGLALAREQELEAVTTERAGVPA
jgi:hypothetical protein